MKKNQSRQAIGVFDSGLGGLTVVKEIMKVLPYEDIVYFGDTARVPYGTKSREAITHFSQQNAQVLLKFRVKMIVVACNSCSSYALEKLKKNFSVPIVGVILPGVKKALAKTKNRKIGVIATKATIHSEAYTKQINKLNPAVNVTAQACPLFVPLAEEGWFQYKETFLIAQKYLRAIIKSKSDTLILGCTHYPLLKNVLKRVVGEKVCLIDSAREVAWEVKELLTKIKALRHPARRPRYQFLISDEPQQFQKLAKRFLGREIESVKKIEV